MKLIVDIGNTLYKIAIFDGDKIVMQRNVDFMDSALLDELIASYGPIKQSVVCSTRGDACCVGEMIRQRVGHCLEFTQQTPIPITNAYLTPATLGRDRLASAVGAATLYPGRNVLIVDLGTAVTFDLVSSDATFRGGCISPGMSMRFRALHEHTSALPLCDPSDGQELLGLTTAQAIERGVMNSLSFEIEGYISRLESQIDDLLVIFTGGDAKSFVKRIKNTIFANCNLVFCGLNRILEYNASEEYHN